MSNRILVLVVVVLVGVIAWLGLDRGPRLLQADTAGPARLGLAETMAGEAAPVSQVSINASQFRIKTVTTGTNWQAFRYNVTTGETVQMVNLKFQKIVEPGAAPAGDYDMESAPLGPNGFSGYALVRIERVSGRMWYLQCNAWVEVQ